MLARKRHVIGRDLLSLGVREPVIDGVAESGISTYTNAAPA
jgi:hypothetical protein